MYVLTEDVTISSSSSISLGVLLYERVFEDAITVIINFTGCYYYINEYNEVGKKRKSISGYVNGMQTDDGYMDMHYKLQLLTSLLPRLWIPLS
eukprot:CAMPEP_0184500676 /NCGR_PEP_ID=MMETSP0113_2-20130426/45493_1 /TAXON_ID=91329 /ORGANISM="Norrisiella sphaerica, Strain BC52" /LENGTH=92 /DNA_ID=CAMNT_0026889145 /DNA_START=223 /DNA_END=498 /DNA_ORIENTATION=-